jgi:NADPH2:quinone reductase
MRAVVLREHGDRDVLHVESVPTPEPGPGEVLLRVHAVSINRSFDLSVRQGAGGYGPVLPLVLGVDPSGVVEATGQGVERPSAGARVTIHPYVACGACAACQSEQPSPCTQRRMIGVHRWGGDAEYLVLPAANVIPIPDKVSFADATVAVRHVPAAYSLARRVGLQAGETVLVMGAAGALGSCALQIARQMGATVIAAAGTDERATATLALSADHAVNYRAVDLERAVLDLTGGRGVDAVFENIGDPTLWPGAFNSLATGGRLVTVGAHGGGTVALDVRRLYSKRLQVVSGLGAEAPEDAQRALDHVAAGSLRMLIDCILPLSKIQEAHRLVEEGSALGKVILDPTLVE